jgi:hypothetical protein
MPLWRYRVPKIVRHAALGHTNDCDLENQSRGRSSCRRSTALLTGTGISGPPLLNTRCNVLSVPTTIWPWICLSELMRSAHCRSMRRWTLDGYMALIRSTSLTRSYVGIKSRGFAFSRWTKSRRPGRFQSKRPNGSSNSASAGPFRAPIVYLVTTPARHRRHALSRRDMM